MQAICLVFFFTFFGGAFAVPKEAWYDSSSSSYSESYDGYPFGYTGGFASAGDGAAAATAGSWPYPGYAAAFSPFFHPFFPFGWPVFKPTIPWYKGPNVCKKTETIADPENVQKWYESDRLRLKGQSKNCQGDGDSMTCSERVVDENGSKVVYTRFECCSNYIRNPKGPGCIEKPSDGAATATDAPTTPVKSEYHRSAGDRFSYVFSSGNKDATLGSDVEKVPPQ